MAFETEYNEDVDLLSDVELAPKVILYNDEVHSFDEVINQIILATGYGYEKAEAITMDVHNLGKAIVFTGEMIKCVRISSVLEEIELLTQIEC